MFYRQMAGISAMPILIDTEDADEFVETVERIAPGFGAIHLEDIKVPECFEIERRLIEALDVPVMHDDVHGTAVATVAAALVACDQAGLELEGATVGQIGLGAAGLGIATLMVEAGARAVLASDPNEGSHDRARERGIEVASFEEVMAARRPGGRDHRRPGPDQARAGPRRPGDPGAHQPRARDRAPRGAGAGAAFAADGTVVNNVLGFPGHLPRRAR